MALNVNCLINRELGSGENFTCFSAAKPKITQFSYAVIGGKFLGLRPASSYYFRRPGCALVMLVVMTFTNVASLAVLDAHSIARLKNCGRIGKQVVGLSPDNSQPVVTVRDSNIGTLSTNFRTWR